MIQKLDNGVHVDLTLDPTATGTGRAIYEVSVQRHADGHLGALAVSNAGLPEGHRLDRAAVAEMVILGWSPPGVVAGSGNDFGLVGTIDRRRADRGHDHQDPARRVRRTAPGVPHLRGARRGRGRRRRSLRSAAARLKPAEPAKASSRCGSTTDGFAALEDP